MIPSQALPAVWWLVLIHTGLYWQCPQPFLSFKRTHDGREQRDYFPPCDLKTPWQAAGQRAGN